MTRCWMAAWRHVGLVVKVSSGPLATTAGNNHEFDNALFRASKVQLEGHSTRSLAFAGESRAPHGGRGKDRRELPRTWGQSSELEHFDSQRNCSSRLQICDLRLGVHCAPQL